MSTREPWSSPSALPLNVHIRVHGVTFHLNKECLISKSAKLASIFQSKQHHDLSIISIPDIPADAEAFELAARFCHNQDAHLSPATVIPVACVAAFLSMTDEHCPNNLLTLSLSFLSSCVLPHWNAAITAFKSSEPVFSQAQHLGLIDACLKSISDKSLAEPHLLICPTDIDQDHKTVSIKNSIRRRLFVRDCGIEDITCLSLPLFELAMSKLIHSSVSREHVAECLLKYAMRWCSRSEQGEQVSIYDISRQKEIIEVVEDLLPNERGVIDVKPLLQLLQSAIVVQASHRCRQSLEARIGKQLSQATVEDLCIPSYDYTKETNYDVDCVMRIMSHFFTSYSGSKPSEANVVADLLEDFTAEAAKDPNLGKNKFVTILEVLAAMLDKVVRCYDGAYRAVDVYFDAHGHMTMAEREEVCRVIECGRLSTEACEHAARNERMPLRMVAQVLYVGQLRLRETITKAVGEEGEGVEKRTTMVDGGKDLKRECERMEKELKIGSAGAGGGGGGRKGNKGLWKEMKEKFGCKRAGDSARNCEVVVKKAHLHHHHHHHHKNDGGISSICGGSSRPS